jgi:hypothetical protein
MEHERIQRTSSWSPTSQKREPALVEPALTVPKQTAPTRIGSISRGSRRKK